MDGTLIRCIGYHHADLSVVQMARLRYVEGVEVSDDLYSLACQPDMRVRLYSACIVDGVRYHTIDREKNRKTQNSGVMVQGTHNGEHIDFYGCLQDIIELQYNSSQDVRRTVVLFRCGWFDLDGKKTRLKDDGYFKSINTASYWYKGDPFILAAQSTKVFYLQDTKFGGDWRVVQKFEHRHLWSVTEAETEKELTYQDDDCTQCPVQENEPIPENLHADDGECHTVPASVVENARNQVDDVNCESDEDDETYMQYCSDNEDRAIPEIDSDEE